jgi:predicted nucleotidyltransferase
VKLQAGYPTTQHENAATHIVEFFGNRKSVDAVLLFCSCARGKATADSCLDIAVLVPEFMDKSDLESLTREWEERDRIDKELIALRQAGRYSEVHLDIIRGEFTPRDQDWGGAQDSFELEIGNYLAYSVPLWSTGEHLRELTSKWMPYYPDDLQRHRLNMVRKNCLNDLHHIPLYKTRGLHFQCFDRLYSAYKEFLQAAFISRRRYPIAYNKWIREQCEEILEITGLYDTLVHLLELRSLESDEIVEKAELVEELLERHAPPPEGAQQS